MVLRRNKVDEEKKKLFYFLSLIDRKLYSQIKRLPPLEQIDALQYSIASTLRNIHLDLEREFEKKKSHIKKSHSGIDYIGHQIALLPSKIRYFEVDFDKGEFKKILSLIKRIQKEVDHV
jgi:hypothetical protein